LRRRYSKDLSGVDIAVTGVPFDQAVTNRPGTRLGPRAIREASALQTFDPPYGWGFDPMSEFAIIDYGDLAFDYAKISDFPAALTAHIKTILDAGAASLVLGGDHFISFQSCGPMPKNTAPCHCCSLTPIPTLGQMTIWSVLITERCFTKLSSWG